MNKTIPPIVYLILFCFPTLAQQTTVSGRFFCPEPEFHFGRLPSQGNCSFYHAFEILNKGQEPLTIFSVSPTCKAMEIRIPEKEILPGKKDSILLAINTNGLSGNINKSVAIFHSGTESHTTIFYLRAFVVVDSACKVENAKEPILEAKQQPVISKPEPIEEEVPIPQPYKHIFDFGSYQIDTSDAHLKHWLDGVVNLVNHNGQVEIQIESSASKVPLSNGMKNLELAESRANSTKKLITALLENRGVKEDQILFDENDAKVQGPDFEPGKDDKKDYIPFQYVKIIIN